MPKKVQISFLNRGLLIAFIGIIADQISKAYILFGLKLADVYHEGMPVIGKFNGSIEITSFFNIALVWNRGVSFGMFNHGEPDPMQLYYLGALTIIIVAVVPTIDGVIFWDSSATTGAEKYSI